MSWKLSGFLTPKDWLLVLLTGMISIAVAFGCLRLLPLGWALLVYKKYTWYVTALTLAGFLGYLFYDLLRTARQKPAGQAGRLTDWILIFSLVTGGSLLLHSFETHEIKISGDEVIVQGISRQMHEQRQTAYPSWAQFMDGEMEILMASMDKRPPFFPFVVSLLHDLSGYRPGNVFAANLLLTPLLLLLITLIGCRIAGRTGSVFSLLLILTLPQLYRSVSGGGMEVLNLVMLLVFIICGWRYLEHPDNQRQALLCLAAILLAYTRYESILFIPAAGIFILMAWLQRGRPIWNTVLFLSPLLLIPNLLLTRLGEFNAGASAFQGGMKAGWDALFSVHYILPNLKSLMHHFFTLDGSQPGSALILAAGVTGLIAIIVNEFRKRREFTEPDYDNLERCFWVLFPFFLILTGIILGFNHGQLDKPSTQRLALPLYLSLSLFGIYGFRLVSSNKKRILLVPVLLFLLVYTLPTVYRHEYSRQYTPSRVVDWKLGFMQKNEAKKNHMLIIDTLPELWICHDFSALSVSTANISPQVVTHIRKYQPELDLLYFQSGFLDSKSGGFLINEHFQLDESTFPKELLGIFEVTPEYGVRVYRLK